MTVIKIEHSGNTHVVTHDASQTDTRKRMIDHLYAVGALPMRFPPPAPKLTTECCLEDWGNNDPGGCHAIVIWYWQLCPGCNEHVVDTAVAVWEFNPLKAAECFIQPGVYTNEREIELGMAARDLVERGNAGRA